MDKTQILGYRHALQLLETICINTAITTITNQQAQDKSDLQITTAIPIGESLMGKRKDLLTKAVT